MLGRSSSHDENGLKKGPWTPEEDQKLIDYIGQNGHGSWRALPLLAGLNRCGKSCRLRWTNYLRPDIKRGNFSEDEEKLIIQLHSHLGNKWSAIATHLPGRTDNEIKNFWNTHLKKKLFQMGIDPVTHQPRTDHLDMFANLPQLLALATNNIGATNLLNPSLFDMNLLAQSDAAQIAKFQLLQNILQLLSTPTASIPQNMDPVYTMKLSEYLKLNPQHLQSLEELAVSESNIPQLSRQDFISPNVDLDNGQESKGFSEHVGKEEYVGVRVGDVNTELGIIKQNDHLSSSNPTSSSTAQDANWQDFMDDEASGCYWKEIVEQPDFLNMDAGGRVHHGPKDCCFV